MDEQITHPHQPPSPSPLFRIWLCGPFQVARYNGTTYDPLPLKAWGGSNDPRRLLKRLLCSPKRQVRRGELQESLWPEIDPDLSRGYFNDASYRLRAALCPDKETKSLLVTSDDHGSMHVPGQAILWVDVDAALSLLAQAEASKQRGDDPLPLVDEAVQYFARGEFLEDEESIWVHGRRGTIERARHGALLWLARLYQERGSLRQAETVLNTLLEQDAMDEDAVCLLMSNLHAQQRTSEALRLFEQTARLLEENGMEVAVATKELLERLRSEPLSQDYILLPPRHTSEPQTQDILEHVDTEQSQHENTTGKAITATVPQAIPDQSDMFTIGIMALILHQQKHQWDVHELEQRVTQAVSEKVTNMQKDQYMSRRAALGFITEIPLALYGIAKISGQSASSLVPEEAIPLYAAGVPTCWRLYFEGGQSELDRVLPTYLSHLTTLAHTPSKHQRSATRLLSQTYQLMALIAQRHENFGQAIEYCKRAARYGQLAEDTNLHVMALVRQGDTYYESRHLARWFLTFKEAEAFAEKITPLLRGRVYARLALAYAYQSQSTVAQRYMGLAQEIFPDNPETDDSFPYSHTMHCVLYANQADMNVKLDRPKEAWEAITKAGEFVSGPTNPRKIDLTYHQIQVAISLDDLELSRHLFETFINFTGQFGQELDVENTYDLYQQMRKQWPHEKQIHQLEEYLHT